MKLFLERHAFLKKALKSDCAREELQAKSTATPENNFEIVSNIFLWTEIRLKSFL